MCKKLQHSNKIYGDSFFFTINIDSLNLIFYVGVEVSTGSHFLAHTES